MFEAETARWHVISDLDVLRSKPVAQRRRTVTTLGQVADDKAVELLTACLMDADVDVIYDAAAALGDIGTAAAVDGLLAVAEDDGCTMTRRVVATLALARVRRIPDHAAVVLRRLATEGDRWARAAARNTLVLLSRD